RGAADVRARDRGTDADRLGDHLGGLIEHRQLFRRHQRPRRSAGLPRRRNPRRCRCRLDELAARRRPATLIHLASERPPRSGRALFRVCGSGEHLTAEPSVLSKRRTAVIDIDPNSSGLPGIEQLRIIVGAVMTVGLILSVLALIVSAIIWAYGSNSSNPRLAGRGKIGVLISCGAAVVCGASVTLINFFWGVGQAV